MPGQKSVMKMPELLVFAKAFALGIVGAEVARLFFYAGQPRRIDEWLLRITLRPIAKIFNQSSQCWTS